MVSSKVNCSSMLGRYRAFQISAAVLVFVCTSACY